MSKTRPNPPQPDETAAQNVRNGLTLISLILQIPELYSRDEVLDMLADAETRLKRAIQQLEGQQA